MIPFKFKELSSEEKDWLDAYLDGTIAPTEFEKFETRMLEDAALRKITRRYLSLDHSLNDLSGKVSAQEWLEPKTGNSTAGRIFSFLPLAAAAAIAFILGTGIMAWKNHADSPTAASSDSSLRESASAQGFAVINSLYDVTWDKSAKAYLEGDTLGAEAFQIKSGTAEIQFFSGANMTVQGPAKIVLTSAWEATCLDGLVRMHVPPAARGFKLHAPSTEIVDLGTEFGLSVRGGKGHVEVFDGEISIRHQNEAQQLITQGKAMDLPAAGSSEPVALGKVAYPDAGQFKSKALEQQRDAWKSWLEHREKLATDERLIAYYSFDQSKTTRIAEDIHLPRNTDRDGSIVLADAVAGRWGKPQSALEFRHPGSRVRVNLPGTFEAFTFAAWVRIDSLDRRYNALFMGDGYENGEPHWQIRDDGTLMLSIMVDTSQPSIYNTDSAGRHKVYFSPKIWEPSMSGEWLHLASSYDPTSRLVKHFLNGKEISAQEIPDTFVAKKLHIGNAEIGNWGDPFRKDPAFSIRNLNGCFDEIAIFNAALSKSEISKLYRNSSSKKR